MHPAIAQHTQQLVAQAPGPYVVVQIPLLAEKQAKSAYDRVLVVDAPVALQEQRLATRDGSEPREIAAMLAAQASRETRLAMADDVLVNDSTPEALRAAVESLHRRYLGLARHSSTIGG
jgi:dephospho-CoA kinase